MSEVCELKVVAAAELQRSKTTPSEARASRAGVSKRVSP
jgi:hypothetical protein